jgi:hypothetical protein
VLGEEPLLDEPPPPPPVEVPVEVVVVVLVSVLDEVAVRLVVPMYASPAAFVL